MYPVHKKVTWMEERDISSDNSVFLLFNRARWTTIAKVDLIMMEIGSTMSNMAGGLVSIPQGISIRGCGSTTFDMGREP